MLWVPIPGSVQDQAGWGFEQPGIVEGIPAHGRGILRSRVLCVFGAYPFLGVPSAPALPAQYRFKYFKKHL